MFSLGPFIASNNSFNTFSGFLTPYCDNTYVPSFSLSTFLRFFTYLVLLSAIIAVPLYLTPGLLVASRYCEISPSNFFFRTLNFRSCLANLFISILRFSTISIVCFPEKP